MRALKVSFLLVSLFLAACASKNVERAFSGDMPLQEETKTISDYCQTCHVHRSFDSAAHLAEITAQYKAKPYSNAKDCKTCHSIEKNFWNDIIRYTYFPEGRLVHE